MPAELEASNPYGAAPPIVTQADAPREAESPREADAPAPESIYRRKIHLGRSLPELWRSRELIRTLAEREIRARYKQAFLGASWAVITPIVLMIVFTVFLRRVAKIDTGGVPYPLFSYLGLLPWTFFSSSVNTGGQSLVSNSSLLNKVYCPREVFPVASVFVAAFDALISTAVLGGLFIIFTFAPKITSVYVPILMIIQIVFTLGVTLALSGVVVYLRDLRQALSILLQLGLFATPVAYGIDDIVAPGLRQLYCALNPLAAVIDGYRRTVVLGLPPRWELLAPAAVTSVLVLLVGYALFKRLETGFADVA
ncbi:MAG: ABC transporter permease [Acidimicrobiales bacterium]